MHPETDYRLEGFNYRNFGAQTMTYVIMLLMASAQSFRSVAIPFKIRLIPNLFVVIPAHSCSVGCIIEFHLFLIQNYSNCSVVAVAIRIK